MIPSLALRLPTCRVWRGNFLPHPDRHVHEGAPPRPVPFGIVSACDLCGWSRHDPKWTPVEEVEERRVAHLLSAHHDDLVAGRATLHLADRLQREADR